jgi:hypothetical protein
MTVTDLEQSVKRSLRAADLLQYLDEEQSQFLEFPDGWFAEIVVKDGSKLAEVESIVQRFKTDLQQQKVGELDEIVRPVWTVAPPIERGLGPSVSFPGLEPAIRFTVTLQSGSLGCRVTVDVTEAALGLIRERLRQTKVPEDAALQEIVSEFVKLEISHGGTSYWDPRRDSRLELNAPAFMYLMGHRDAYDRLKRSVDNALKLDKGSLKQKTTEEILRLGSDSEKLKSVEAFAKQLSGAQVKIMDFERALPYLPGTGNYELYAALLDFEKDNLKSYYLDNVRRAEEEFPDLKRRFPAVFN